jgi:nucleoside-diphosphate-sugar epimerase
VVHCVATNAQELAEARRVNVETTAALAQAALAAGCERFVHISTVAVYPLREREGVVEEDSPLVTEGDPYSVTKAEAERALNEVAARGLRTVILRPPLILGVHPSSYWGTRYPQMIAAGQFPQVDGGRTTLGHVHIRSLTEAVVRSLRVDEAAGQAFNIADGHETWRRYTDHFIGTRPLPALPAEQAPAFLSFRGRYALEKARRVLGFTPRDNFAASMAEIVESLPRP